ncbi:MAG: hypothetical protein J5779_03265 [Clostridia bacterium]|nr:hypothetical protein [Clostridia bacterium]
MQNQQTLILSSLNSGNEKAVLTFEQTNNLVEGKIRLYNFKEQISGILSLAFMSEGKIMKCALNFLNNNYYAFKTENDLNLKKFTCALVNIKNGIASPLLLGASNGNTPQTLDLKLAENLYLLDDENLTTEKVANAIKKSGLNYSDELEQDIECAISAELGGVEKCANCKYREAFFKDTKTVTTNATKTQKPQVLETENFYDEIKEQIESLFNKYPEETFLNEVIPNSKWIKVDYEENGEFYVIGLIYEDEKIKYISYGVPGEFKIKPPKELTENAQWLPLDPTKPEDLGFWLTYQNAENGESVNIEVS